LQNAIMLLAQTVPEGRVFGMDSQTLIQIGIMLFNGIILALALGFILYNPVKEFLQKRSESIQGRIDEAEEAMTKANELIAEYTRRIEEIDKERVEILENARLKADEEGEAMVEEAKKEIEEMKRRSIETISEEKRRLKEEARLYIIELASLMAQRYVSLSMDDEAQARLFEEALAQMEDSQWQS
jgi:F-type H+-transporting ATPase subunit b